MKTRLGPRTGIIVAIVFIAHGAFSSAQTAPTSLELSIRQPSLPPAGKTPCYVDSRKLPVQLTVTNRDSRDVDVLLKDHDENGIQQAVLTGLQAHLMGVWASNQWCDPASLQAVNSPTHLLPGDLVVLKPGQSVKRVINLAHLLGCHPPHGDLLPGTYQVRLRLNGVTSDIMTFRIADSHGCD